MITNSVNKHFHDISSYAFKRIIERKSAKKCVNFMALHCVSDKLDVIFSSKVLEHLRLDHTCFFQTIHKRANKSL